MQCGKKSIYHPSRSSSLRYYLHEVLTSRSFVRKSVWRCYRYKYCAIQIITVLEKPRPLSLSGKFRILNFRFIDLWVSSISAQICRKVKVQLRTAEPHKIMGPMKMGYGYSLPHDKTRVLPEIYPPPPPFCHPSWHGLDCPPVVVIVQDRTVRTVLLL